MAKLWKRVRGQGGKSELEEIDQGNLRISSPTIVFLTGFFTVNEKPAAIAGAIKHIEELLGCKPGTNQPVDIYAWSHKSLANMFNLITYNTRPNKFSSGAAKKLARNVILPLVADNLAEDDLGRLYGDRLDRAEAEKRLNNLTLFGYSAGTILAQETFNAAHKMMQDIGYKADEARGLLNNVVLISTGNMSRPQKEKNRFTTLYLAATNDRLIKLKNRLWLSLRELFGRFHKDLRIREMSKTSLYISAPVKKEMFVWKEIDGKLTRKPIRLLYPKFLMRRSYHELPHYTTDEDGNNSFSKIVNFALVNAVNRNATPDVTALLEPCPPLVPANKTYSPQEIACYRERIKKARQPK